MAITHGIFGDEPNFQDRLIPTLEELGRKVAQLREGFGIKVVLTSGSYDLIHLGHLKYLAKARTFGNILVVGVDSDAKIRARKGEGRPMVPERERLEVLAHTRPVDIIYLKDPKDPQWSLIRAVKPDVLVLSEDHKYSDSELDELRKLCGSIEVLDRQDSITTSERIRQMFMDLGEKLGPRLAEVLTGSITELISHRLPDMIDKAAKGERE